jgi:hypothetical protein
MTIKPSDLGATTQNWIGRSQFSDPYLDGRVDDFRIYNRAISSSEVASVMNGQTLETATTAPTGVTAATADHRSINVSWSAVPGATGYHVYVADSLAENAIYTKANSDLITGTSYVSLGLKPITAYHYKVTAVNAQGESDMSAIASATTDGMPIASPISWYKLDETSGTAAADASGNGNHGTVNGGAAWGTGQFGGAADLNGTNGYIALPSGLMSGADTITIAAWVNLDTVSNWTRIFDFGSGTSTSMFLTPRNGANGKIRFAIKNNGSSEQIIDGQSALPTGGWHHVAVTLNGSTGTLYVDGTQVGSNTSMTIKPSDLGATTQNWIGRSQYPDPYLDGRVDDFRIYGQALPADEIAALAAPGLITWYKFDQTGGTAVADSSGDFNHGTMNGGAAWTTGNVGNAADLNGTNGYIALPSGIVSGTDTITIAAWVNLDRVNNWTRIFDFGSGTSTNMFLTPRNGANGKIRFAIKNNGSSEQIIDGQSALLAGGWHHVAVTLNGSTGTLYVDGTQVGSNTSMTIKPSDLGPTTQNWIGRSQYTSDPYLDGRVDDFRIYNQALSAGEIAALAGL